MLPMLLVCCSEPLAWCLRRPSCCRPSSYLQPCAKACHWAIGVASKFTSPTLGQSSVTDWLTWGRKRPAPLPQGRTNSVVWFMLQSTWRAEAVSPEHLCSAFFVSYPTSCTPLQVAPKSILLVSQSIAQKSPGSALREADMKHKVSLGSN